MVDLWIEDGSAMSVPSGFFTGGRIVVRFFVQSRRIARVLRRRQVRNVAPLRREKSEQNVVSFERRQEGRFSSSRVVVGSVLVIVW